MTVYVVMSESRLDVFGSRKRATKAVAKYQKAKGWREDDTYYSTQAGVKTWWVGEDHEDEIKMFTKKVKA